MLDTKKQTGKLPKRALPKECRLLLYGMLVNSYLFVSYWVQNCMLCNCKGTKKMENRKVFHSNYEGYSSSYSKISPG